MGEFSVVFCCALKDYVLNIFSTVANFCKFKDEKFVNGAVSNEKWCVYCTPMHLCDNSEFDC